MNATSAAEDERNRSVEAVLRKCFFASCPAGYLESDWGRNDLQNHIDRRLRVDRTVVVPWLNAITALSGATVLEIGCGTGSSTVALAERGANVTAVDLDEPAVTVARERCRLHGVNAELVLANAAELPDAIRTRRFDLVIFYASLEHMTIPERHRAISQTWEMLPPGACLAVIETPNRLWYFDDHTSLLPFFQWLPDDLAFRYSRLSPRPRFNDLYREPTAESMLHFLRRGRGVSFHEFELVIGHLDDSRLAGWLDWHKRKSLWKRVSSFRSVDRSYLRLLRRAAPKVHEAFLQPQLDLAIRK